MPMNVQLVVVVSGLIILATVEAEAGEYQCKKIDSSMRIAVEVNKEGHTLPCEVITEDDRGRRAVLHKAQYDRQFCPSKLETVRSDLEDDGWACEKTSETNIAKRVDASTDEVIEKASDQSDELSNRGDGNLAVNGRAILSSRECRKGEDIRRIRVEVEDLDSQKPCALLYWGHGDDSQPGELLWRAEHDASFCPKRLEVIVGNWTDEGWRCAAEDVQIAAFDKKLSVESGQTDERQLTEGRLVDDDAALEAIIAADAERIGQWMDVEPDIEIAARGDLNEDGADDAVVFLAYESDQSIYRQYLMSYLLAEEGFELASVKLLDGFSPPAQARVDQIEKGVIWLTLPDEDGSASAPTGYRLQDHELIEIEPKTLSTSN